MCSAHSAQRTAYRDNETVQLSFLRQLHLTGEARGVAPESQGVVGTAKS